MVSENHPLDIRISHLLPNGTSNSTRRLKLDAYCQMANMNKWITYVSQVMPNNTCQSSMK